VLAVERSATVAALWREALPQAPRGLSFVKGDAKDLLRDLAAIGIRPDAVYVDAMYPAGKRKAASRKDLVLLREIVGDDVDVEALLDVALEVASKRVVVKRPKKAQALRGGVAHSWVCASTRYDLYLVDRKTSFAGADSRPKVATQQSDRWPMMYISALAALSEREHVDLARGRRGQVKLVQPGRAGR